MKPRTALLQLLLLTMTVAASGQALPAASEGQLQRPLNLTLPKQAARDANPAALTVGLEAVAAGRLAGSLREDGQAVGRLPYGVGYESRQQGGASMASGGSGRGAGGQGGMGRRR